MMSSPRPGNPSRSCRAPSARLGVLGLCHSRSQGDAPGFLFLAEGYWGLEARLQALGFDYTYDKPLYDGLVRATQCGVQRHLLG